MTCALMVLSIGNLILLCLAAARAARYAKKARVDDLWEKISRVSVDVEGATRNSAECYNMLRQAYDELQKAIGDVKSAARDCGAGIREEIASAGTALTADADRAARKMNSAGTNAAQKAADALAPFVESAKSSVSVLKSATEALIESVTITRNSDGVVPTELLKELLAATDKEDQEAFADAVGKARAFLALYQPVEDKLVREKAVKKTAKPKQKRANYGFF